MGKPDLVVVWGNCQAAPLADLLRAPLAAAGLEVVDVPPVFLADEADLVRVQRLVAEAAVLVSHPIREEYRVAGCGTAALAAHLPAGGRLVTVASAFHTGPFPHLVNAHGGDGQRVDAPLTDYHDLRTIIAAARGLDVDAALADRAPLTGAALRARAATSLERLRRREATVDVAVSDALSGPDALWTMNHPANRVLAHVARGVLAAIGVAAPVTVPAREYLAERRAPVEAAVAEALGWPPSAARPDWVVRGQVLDQHDVTAAHLRFYAERPDVVADSLHRFDVNLTLDAG